MPTDRGIVDTVYRRHFGAFVHAAFEIVHPGSKLVPSWHIDCVCHRLQQMVVGQQPKRLVLNQPPRSLKSFVCSVALPAWLLGQNPGKRIICASYSDDLAGKFSRDCRALVESALYRRIFPRTRPSPGRQLKENSRRHVEDSG
jgi:hypothetical protein